MPRGLVNDQLLITEERVRISVINRKGFTVLGDVMKKLKVKLICDIKQLSIFFI